MEQIIKCKNCEYFHKWDDGSSPTCMYWTVDWDMGTEPDGFCSFGKLKLGCEAETYDIVKHGHWIDGTCGSYKICSVCGQISDFDFDYCPNCGAKMDE